jgi:dephospho-CoA kinase
MLVVGVTGGIGAGKSTVSGMMLQLGARIIDADQMAREVVDKDPQVLQELVRAFGPSVLMSDGSLNRRELGRKAFRDRGGRRRLNEILHPPILARLKCRLAQFLREGYRGIVVVDAALLVECRALTLVDRLVVVEAPEDIRRRRLMDLQGLSTREIRDRMAAQLPPEEKSRRAHYLVVNDGDLDRLEERVGQVWRMLEEDLSHKGD